MDSKNKIFAIMQKNTQGAKPPNQPPLRPPRAEPPRVVEPRKGEVKRSPGSAGSAGSAGKETREIMSGEDIINLKEHLKSLPNKMEIEVSFGNFVYYKDYKSGEMRENFQPGVSVAQFNLALAFLSSLAMDGVCRETVENTNEEIDSTSRIKKITKLGDAGRDFVIWQTKQRHVNDTIDNKTWGYRINKSTEKIYDTLASIPNARGTFTPSFWRKKERRSFVVLPKDSKIFGVQFDLTKVKESKTFFSKKTNRNEIATETKFEIEIERNSIIDYKIIEKSIETILNVIQKAIIPNQLITQPERLEITSLHNNLFANDKKYRTESGYKLFKGYENKPKNIKIDDLLNPESKYFVTLKVDGTRGFIFVSNGTYVCSPPNDIWKIGGSVHPLNGTLIDSEIYIHPETKQITYYTFDILFHQGQDVREKYFHDRLSLLKEVTPKLQLFNGNTAQVKNFYGGGDSVYKNVESVFEEGKIFVDEGVALDGLIFQSHTKYSNPFTRKWKPAESLTIDFKLKFIKDDEYELDVYTSAEIPSKKYIPFKGSFKNPHENFIINISNDLALPNSGGILIKVPPEGLIVECEWNYENSIFVPIRHRDDRDEPNYETVAADVWDDIVNPMTKDTIKGENLITMRRFHNLMKKHFLETEFRKGDTIVDWGSGRGGDIDKWWKIGLDKVFAVEPNEENFLIFGKRLDEKKKRDPGGPQVFAVGEDGKPLTDDGLVAGAGAENTKAISKILGDTQVDGITSFFSLTFFGKDKTLYDEMVNTIDKVLPVGGKFLGIVMDGKKSQNLLESDSEAQEGEALIYDCPAFKIQQVTNFEPNKVKEGANEIEIQIKEATSMVDQTEWLFYFDVFRKTLENIGFEIKYDGFLDEKSPLVEFAGSKKKEQLFNMLPKEAKVFSSLNRYFLFVRKSLKKIKGTKTSAKKESPVKPVGKEDPMGNLAVQDHKNRQEDDRLYLEGVQNSKDVKLDRNLDFDFDFAKTFWKDKIPKGEDKDYFLIRPVPNAVSRKKSESLRTKHGVIYAILYAIDPKFSKLSFLERVTRVSNVVHMIARKTDFTLYNKVMGNSKFDLFGRENPQRQRTEEDYVKFQIDLLSGYEYSSRIYATILSHLLKINILLIEILGNNLQLDSEWEAFGCYKNSIVIFQLPSSGQFDVIAYSSEARGDEYAPRMIYKTKSPFIIQIIKYIAESKKLNGARLPIL